MHAQKLNSNFGMFMHSVDEDGEKYNKNKTPQIVQRLQ